jgi:hypothetical protein
MSNYYQQALTYFRKVNGPLLLFLVLFMNVKILVKLGVLLIFLLLTIRRSAVNEFLKQHYAWFYICMILLCIVAPFVYLGKISEDFIVMVLAGIGGWLVCLGAAYIIYQYVRGTAMVKLHHTIQAFFLINAFFTFGQLLFIMWDAGNLNPYTYQGMNQKYFIGTGDLLRGISFDVSTTNATFNAFAVLYFLDKRKMSSLLCCMAALLLTASNFTIVFLMLVLLFLFLFKSDRLQKSMIILCTCMLVIFLARVSPQNKHYLKYVYQKLSRSAIDSIPPDIGKPSISTLPDSVLDTEGIRKKTALLYLDSLRLVLAENKNMVPVAVPAIQHTLSVETRPSLPKANIHTAEYQRNRDTTQQQKQLINFALNNIPAFDTNQDHLQKQLPGKFMAYRQTFQYLSAHPQFLFTGVGPGQFSSKLAFRATGMGLSGSYPARWQYVNPAFRDNHLKIYLDYFSKDTEGHSVVNSPDSVYVQLISEYGLAGLLAFLLLYVRYFITGIYNRSYSLSILLLMSAILLAGYWFEQLSIFIVFELMMLMHLKTNLEKKVP